MNKDNLKNATPIGIKYNLGEFEDRKELYEILESGLYGCKNEDGEDVLVFFEKDEGMDIHTFQDNGWLRVNYFNNEGYSDGETFKGRWK